jgi:hypothetical protein
MQCFNRFLFSESHERELALCRRDEELPDVKAGGIYNYHRALKCNHEQLNQGCVPACLGVGCVCSVIVRVQAMG